MKYVFHTFCAYEQNYNGDNSPVLHVGKNVF